MDSTHGQGLCIIIASPPSSAWSAIKNSAWRLFATNEYRITARWTYAHFNSLRSHFKWLQMKQRRIHVYSFTMRIFKIFDYKQKCVKIRAMTSRHGYGILRCLCEDHVQCFISYAIYIKLVTRLSLDCRRWAIDATEYTYARKKTYDEWEKMEKSGSFYMFAYINDYKVEFKTQTIILNITLAHCGFGNAASSINPIKGKPTSTNWHINSQL